MTKNTARRPHQLGRAGISHKSDHFVCQTLSNRHQEGGQPQVGGQDERADTRIARGRDLNLPAKATLDQPKGYLNPSWVEQLMGLPKGWTQLSSAETESDNRVPRLKLLGNGVVPQCASKAFAILFNQIMNG